MGIRRREASIVCQGHSPYFPSYTGILWGRDYIPTLHLKKTGVISERLNNLPEIMKLVTRHRYGFPVKGSRETVNLLREKKVVFVFILLPVTTSCCLTKLAWESPDAQITAIHWLVPFRVPISEILWIIAVVFTGSLNTS